MRIPACTGLPAEDKITLRGQRTERTWSVERGARRIRVRRIRVKP